METERGEERERGFLPGTFFLNGRFPSIVFHSPSCPWHSPVFFVFKNRHDDRMLSANSHGSVFLM